MAKTLKWMFVGVHKYSQNKCHSSLSMQSTHLLKYNNKIIIDVSIKENYQAKNVRVV